jgi:Domain of unknown function (DUF4194)
MTFPRAEATAPSELSIVVVNLCKGPIYRDTHERAWALLLAMRSQVADYVSVLGLQVVVDEAEGYAYLRSDPSDDAADEGEAVPRLIARRKLPFHVSLLLALLRKRLAEFDASSAETRLVLSRDQMVEMMRLFLPESTNDALLVDTIGRHVNRVEELGFLRRLRGRDDLFEVRRIIKAYVDGQWLSSFDASLDEYLAGLREVGGEETR